MAALATAADAVRFGYTLPAGEESKLLDRASVRLRRAAGQQISETTSTVRLRVDGGVVTLPGPPVTAVATVAKLAEDGGSTLTGWRWDGYDRVTCIPWCYDVNVTYTHGFAPIPDELLELVCSVAARLGSAPTSGGMEAGVRSESIDDYQVTYATDSLESASGLLEGEESQLRAFLGDPPSAYMVRLR
ncbi:hypothetical protein ACFXJ8_26030 [Nonomuraea sp. NPDC059194]|uniref:hypothetical protein n=1 Tax=Nonomuraea sp. NPDC059194 TaxID=3346764 RepID=UPI003689B55A